MLLNSCEKEENLFGKKLLPPLHLQPPRGKEFYGVKVAQLILVQLVLVRIQVELRKL